MTTNPAGSQLSNRSLDGQAQIVQRAASAWCALAGFLVLVVGWGFGVSWVRTVLAGAPYVRVNAAIGLMVLGAALWPNRRWRRFAAMAGGLAALIGVLTVVEYAFGVNLRIDELAMRDNMPQVPGWPPGRMALTSAVCFALLGAGLALSAFGRAISAIQWLALPVAGLSMGGLFGYVYGVPNAYGLACYMSMPVHVAFAFFVAAMALLFAHPHRGAMRIVIGNGPGGGISRRLLPAALLLPPFFGWLRWQGERLGYYDTAFGLSLFTSANAISFATLIWAVARALDRTDARRTDAERNLRASEEKFRALLESTPDAMIITDREGRMVLVNAQAEALFGYRREELLGEPIENLVPQEVRAGHREHRAAFAAAPEMREMHHSLAGIRGLKKNGEVFHAGIALNAIWTPDGLRVIAVVCDLTVRDLAEAALRESEARFRQLADAMPQIVWTAGPSGDVDYHNQRWYAYTGQTSAESLGWGWQPVLQAGDLADCIERRTRAIAAGEAYEIEYRLRRAADGEYRWHLGRATPVRDGAGAVVRWFGTCTDIDDYKRAEEETRRAWLEVKSLNETLEQRVRERTLQLRDSEARFRHMVEGVRNYAILTLDPQGSVISWTDAAERLKGYSAAEILGSNFARFFTAEDIAGGHPEEALRAAALHGHFEEQGWRVRKDGSRFWADVSLTAMRDETGELRGFSKIAHDVTERKQSEDKILQSEETFRALLESAPDALVVSDAQGTVALINAQAERMFGYGPEIVGQPVAMLLPVRAPQMGVGIELSGIRKNGEEFPVEVSLSPVETAQGSWVAAAVRDIGERKRFERQLVIARQQAEDANRAKSAFLAAMSHEIRTPMNAILGMSDLLSETDLDDAQRQYVQIFRRAGSSLLSLINDILDLSKIEAGHLDLERTEFHLRELVDQTVELVARKAHDKGIALVRRFRPGIPNWFAGDQARLRQVLINLLGNAIKFTDAGEVVLTVQELPGGPPGHLEFLVSDTGIGIPPEQLATVFEDFTQCDCSTTRKYGGSGLGLAISRRIVERMGGAVAVVSEVGKGSTFRFNVPLQPAPDRREEQVEVRDFEGQRVAIIDSNTTNRLILRETLAGWGLQTTEFASSEDALADLTGMPHAQRAYSFIIVDSRVDRRVSGGLAPIDGFETGARIRTIFPDLPMVMLSSDDLPGDEARSRESGFSGYAVRPVSRAGLLQLVSKALGGSRTEAAAPAGQPAPGSSSGIAPRKPLRILVAEDSPDNRLLVQLYLEGSPHSLTCVEHGGEAVDRAATEEFDVVLMDVQMPVMDGLTATRKIRTMELARGRRAVPILALSANARPEDIASSLAAGCTAHLSKPISKQRLLAALDEHANALPAGNPQ
jgi:PAS domain S-box-containing protein